MSEKLQVKVAGEKFTIMFYSLYLQEVLLFTVTINVQEVVLHIS